MLKILHVIPTVNPSSGGPAEGVRRRGIHLKAQGHQVDVVTMDSPTDEHLRDYPLTVVALGRKGGRYSYSPGLKSWIAKNARDYDLVVVNGIWQYHSWAAFEALRSIRKPYVLFTHGMLDPWFNKAYPLKHLKKQIYWLWRERKVVAGAAKVLFTSEEERAVSARAFIPYRANGVVVPYGTQQPPPTTSADIELLLSKHPKLVGKKVFLYLSRLHEKKGLDILLNAFANIKEHSDAHLLIVGTGDREYVESLSRLAGRVGVSDRVTWAGMLQGGLKWAAFRVADAFVLPSHQENFGIAVVEALGAGVPVLISNKVNIWREVVADGAGVVFSDDVAGTEEALRKWLTLSAECKDVFRTASLECFQQRYTVDRMADALIDVANDFRVHGKENL